MYDDVRMVYVQTAPETAVLIPSVPRQCVEPGGRSFRKETNPVDQIWHLTTKHLTSTFYTCPSRLLILLAQSFVTAADQKHCFLTSSNVISLSKPPPMIIPHSSSDESVGIIDAYRPLPAHMVGVLSFVAAFLGCIVVPTACDYARTS